MQQLFSLQKITYILYKMQSCCFDFDQEKKPGLHFVIASYLRQEVVCQGSKETVFIFQLLINPYILIAE